MTEPPAGWTSPSGEPAAPATPPPAYGYGPGYGTVPGYGAAPGWGTPPPYGAPVGLKPGVVPLRPLTVGELLDGAVSIIRRYPRPTLGMSALVAVVTTVLKVAALLATDVSAFTSEVRSGRDSAGVGTTGSGGGSLGGIPGSVFGFLGGLVLTGALVVVVGKAVLGNPTSTGEVWRTVRGRLWALIGLALLTGLICGGVAAAGVGAAIGIGLVAGPLGLIVAIPLGIAGVLGSIYLYGRLSLAPAVLVLEKAGIRTALSRSGALVKGSWWRVFLILVLTSIISFFVAGILIVPFAIIGFITLFSSDASTGAAIALIVLTQVGAGLASFLVAPFTASVRALLYVDRRMRAEGLDLTLQAAARQ
jgi:hypothetical protein